jgi:Putative polyhydroxyalkanoic acid system protein (PHA_gran_rgn)
MAHLDITIPHDHPDEVAQAKLGLAVREFQARYSSLIRELEWADDGRSATISGAGFKVRCWYDEHEVHVKGTIPLAWKLFEGAIRGHIKSDIERAVPAKGVH